MSTFSLNDNQRQIKDSMHRFAVDEIRPLAEQGDEDGVMSAAFLEKSWQLGLSTSVIPEDYGGYGFDRSVLDNVIMIEELAWGDLSMGIAMITPNLFVLPVLEMGSDEQQRRCLPGFCEETYAAGSLAIMEHSPRFDVSNIRTTAKRASDHYVINGEKCLVPMADNARCFIVIATEDPGSGYGGVGAFIVEKGTRGLKVKAREKNMGLHALESFRVGFSDLEVPLENRIEGFDYTRLIACSRIGLAAAANGVAEASKEYCLDYAKQRDAFGFPIATRQSIAFMLADMAIEADASRLLTLEAAWTADRGENALRMAYLAKDYAASKAFKTADMGVSIMGGHGLIREYPVERWFRNARAFSMLEGMIMA
ncbi:MAG: acyl-CoA dehydrogenase family protein [Thermodesulfobacteriota bacterium]|nr:acyl-CoA dehydrogenase family protein [Thermodesulfobacteriota bacterium]